MCSLFPVICSIITFIMCFLHILLVLGVPIGEYVLGGKDRVIPREKRHIDGIIACVFLFIGLFYLGKAGLISFYFSPLFSKGIMIAYTAFLAYAIIGNIFFTKSKKEKIVMIPASVIAFICSLFTLLLV